MRPRTGHRAAAFAAVPSVAAAVFAALFRLLLLLSLLLMLRELLFCLPPEAHDGAQNGSPNDKKWCQNEAKMAPGGLRGPPGDPLGHAIKIDPGALLEASGGEKQFTGSGRGGSRKVLGQFLSVLSRAQGDFDLNFGASGSSRGFILEAHCPKPPNA